jgi:hypothetical protein
VNVLIRSRQEQIIGLLLDGASVRHVSRMTGHNKNTVNRLVRLLANVADWQYGSVRVGSEHKSNMVSALSGDERSVRSGDPLPRLRAHLERGCPLASLLEWLPATPLPRRGPYRSTLRAWRANRA